MTYEEQLFSLNGEIAVITGGAGVLPGAVTRTLLKAGASVVIWGRGTGHPVDKAVAAVIEETGVSEDRVAGVTVDTANEDAVVDAIAETERIMGVPTILVNGVGGNRGKSALVDVDIETFNDVVKMNLGAGLIVPLKHFARYWIEKKQSATVINFASMTSYKALSGVWAYNAAKSAVLNLTEGAAKELAPFGIRVNGIAPGFFLGYQNRALLVKDDATGELTDRGKAIIGRTPFGRFGRLDDMEGVTLFLASSRASGFVTGVTIPVDGGYLTDNI